MSLHPTKTRLRLLEAVQAGEVKHVRRWVSNKPDYDLWESPVDSAVKVTRRMEELVREGWARFGRATHASMYAPQIYEITAEGERVLAEHQGGTDG